MSSDYYGFIAGEIADEGRKIAMPGMFGRYTDRARRAVVLADQEAASLGHDTVDTGHLLLGLIREGEGVAFKALAALGVTVDLAGGEYVSRRPHGDADPQGTGARPFTPDMRKALELATREALQLGCSYVATEHLLLALIRDGDGPGTLALADCGIAKGDAGFLAGVRAKVMELLHGYAEADRARKLAGTPVARGPRIDPETGYQLITLGGVTVAVVPVDDLRRLLDIAKQAMAP